jgi:hypothetical protein
LVSVLLLAGLWWVVRPAGRRVWQALAALAGAAVGFSPWLIYNATHNWWGLGRFADAVNKTDGPAGKLAAGLGRLGSLLVTDIAAGLHFRAESLTTVKVLSYGYYLPLVGLTIFLTVRYRAALVAALKAVWPQAPSARHDGGVWVLAPVVYAALYALVFSFTDYGLFAREWGTMDPESHCHIFALYPPLLLVAGLAVGAGFATRWRAATIGAAALLVALGGVGYAGLLTPDRPQTERLARPGYDRGVIYMEIGSKWGADHAQLARIQAQLDGHPLRAFVHGAGIKYGLDHGGSLNVAIDKCRAQPDSLLPYCLFGVGTGLYAGDAVSLETRDLAVNAAPEAVRPWLVLGGCVGNIWTGQVEHWTCEQAPAIDVRPLAPPGEADTLAVFVSGHLAMLQFRPVKQ